MTARFIKISVSVNNIVKVLEMLYYFAMTDAFPVGLPERCQTCPKLQSSLQVWRLYDLSAHGSRLLLETLEGVGQQNGAEFYDMGRVALESAYEADEYRRHIIDDALECIYDEQAPTCPSPN